jgi:hypothetical protein
LVVAVVAVLAEITEAVPIQQMQAVAVALEAMLRAG